MIIYTCITNGYDEIPDDNYYDPDVQYVCFTDRSIEKKGPWEFREIPIEHECPRRLSSYPKINPHKLFSIGSKVVWIDGCYVHTKKWVELSKKILDEHPRTHMLHEHRFTYYEEVLEGFVSSFNTKEDIIEITNTLNEVEYNFKKYSSPVLACIWRTITEDSFEFHDLWWKYSLIGPNRDQISFDAAKQLSELQWNVMENWWDACIDFSYDTGKSARKKLHPQAGHFEQYKERDILLRELYTIIKLHPSIYAKYMFEKSIKRWVLDPILPRS